MNNLDLAKSIISRFLGGKDNINKVFNCDQIEGRS